MCGIAGLIREAGQPRQRLLEDDVRRMTSTLTHRGPDDSGTWVDPISGIALGQRRLAIVDLSPLGHQPMWSPGGRYLAVFNGEVYNWRQLRAELADGGVQFRSMSDTEVMLAAIEQWGLDEALSRIVGMFALAIWDSRDQRLSLSRDRLGEKPLFLARMGADLAFASEIRAFAALPTWRPDVSIRAVGELLRFGYIASGAGIYEQVYRVPPGAIIDIDTARADLVRVEHSMLRGASPRHFWTPVPRGGIGTFNGTRDDAVTHLDELLRNTVKNELVADVPIGAFLSGGVDSTVVVAIAQSVSNSPVQTFSIGFDEPDFDEAPFARAIARHLGTKHTEVYLSASDALGVVRQLGTIFDEPFADPSQIPSYLVSRVARQHVTVCLSGDGGDEVFGGYNRYFAESSSVRNAAAFPLPLRRTAARLLKWTAARDHDGLLATIAKRLAGGRNGPIQDALGRFEKLGRMLECRDAPERYWALISQWQSPAEALPGLREDGALKAHLADLLDQYSPSLAFMLWDMMHYLPGDNLTKVDRTSMAVSLETRAPLLDHRIVDFSLPVLARFGVRGSNGATKWPLRSLMDRYVPPSLTSRPKMGFSVPVRAWLRRELRDWADDLLSEDALRVPGVFAPEVIRSLWNEHCQGHRDRSKLLWPVLMFQQWYLAQWR